MVKSLYNNRIGIIFIAFSAFFVATGQLFWKIGTEEGIIYLGLGFFSYSLGALLLIISFRFGEVSVLHPFLSLNYIFALYLGLVVLEEEISLVRVFGVIVIILGVIMIGTTSHE